MSSNLDESLGYQESLNGPDYGDPGGAAGWPATVRTLHDRLASRTAVLEARTSLSAREEPYGADPTATLDAATAIGNALGGAGAEIVTGEGGRHALYVPAGHYLIQSGLPTIDQPIEIIGDGTHRTIIELGSSLTGAAFTISDTWFNALGTTVRAQDPTTDYAMHRAGFTMRGISIIGSRNNANQAGIDFQGVNDNARFDDVELDSITGTALSLAAPGRATNTMRESEFRGVRVRRCGAAGSPAVLLEHDSGFTSDGLNNLTFYSFVVIYPHAQAIRIANDSSKTMRRLNFYDFWVHGANKTQITAAGDDYEDYRPNEHLIEIEGEVSRVNVFGFKSNHADEDHYILSFNKSASGNQPQNWRVYGWEGQNVQGGFLDLQGGAQLSFDISLLNGANSESTGVHDIQIGPNFQGPVALPNAVSSWDIDIDASFSGTIAASTGLHTSVPAHSYRYRVGSGITNLPEVQRVAGSPEGSLALPAGSLALNSDGLGGGFPGAFLKRGGVLNTGWDPLQVARVIPYASLPTLDAGAEGVMYTVEWSDGTIGVALWDGSAWQASKLEAATSSPPSGDGLTNEDVDGSNITVSTDITAADAHHRGTYRVTGSRTITINTGLRSRWTAEGFNEGTGMITIAAGAGVTLLPGVVTISLQYAGFAIRQIGSETYAVVGELD